MYEKQIRFVLDNELYKKIKAQENCSEFIREALREKLSRGNNEDKEFNALMKQIKKLDPLAMHSEIKDLTLTTQILFQNAKKQNEVLKLLLNRVSRSANFSNKLISADDSTLIIAAVEKRHAAEIKALGI